MSRNSISWNKIRHTTNRTFRIVVNTPSEGKRSAQVIFVETVLNDFESTNQMLSLECSKKPFKLSLSAMYDVWRSITMTRNSTPSSKSSSPTAKIICLCSGKCTIWSVNNSLKLIDLICDTYDKGKREDIRRLIHGSVEMGFRTPRSQTHAVVVLEAHAYLRPIWARRPCFRVNSYVVTISLPCTI